MQSSSLLLSCAVCILAFQQPFTFAQGLPKAELDALKALQDGAAASNKLPIQQRFLIRLIADGEQLDLADVALATKDNKSGLTGPVTELEVHHHDSGYFGYGLADIAKLSKVRKLEFNECAFDKEGGHLFEIAKGCPEIESLSFRGCVFDRPVIRLMATFPKLKHLEVESSYLGDGILSYDQCFPRLETLALFQSGAADREAANLAKLSSLRRVDIQECGLTGKGVRLIAGMKTMKFVFAESIDISDEEAERIEKDFAKIHCEVYGEQKLIENADTDK